MNIHSDETIKNSIDDLFQMIKLQATGDKVQLQEYQKAVAAIQEICQRKSKLKLKIFKPQVLKSCAICFGNIDVFQLECGEEVCKTCLSQYLDTVMNNQTMIFTQDELHDECIVHPQSDIDTKETSQIKNPINQVKHFTLELAYHCNMKFYEIFLNHGSIECPGCKTCFSDPRENGVSIQCPKCKISLCVTCKGKSHDKLSDCQLKIQIPDSGELLTNKYIYEQIASGEQSFCPYCEIPVVKQDQTKCDKLFCTQCKNEFDSCCSTKRSINMAHNVAKHRQGCKFVNEQTYRDSFQHLQWEAKCEECQKSGKDKIQCPNPESWDEFLAYLREFYQISQI